MLRPKVIPIHRPKTFTENERIIEQVRIAIFNCGHTYKDIAGACNISRTTVAHLASGKTKWPRPRTLFPLVDFLGLKLILVKK
jgi:transcriptional regulator with XRE-family HTH domain